MLKKLPYQTKVIQIFQPKAIINRIQFLFSYSPTPPPKPENPSYLPSSSTPLHLTSIRWVWCFGFHFTEILGGRLGASQPPGRCTTPGAASLKSSPGCCHLAICFSLGTQGGVQSSSGDLWEIWHFESRSSFGCTKRHFRWTFFKNWKRDDIKPILIIMQLYDMMRNGFIYSYISVDLLYQCLIWTFSRWYFFRPYRTRVTFNAALKPGVFFGFLNLVDSPLLSQRPGEICEEKSQETRRIHEELVAERLQELLATNHSQVSTVLHPQEMAAPAAPKFLPPLPGGFG